MYCDHFFPRFLPLNFPHSSRPLPFPNEFPYFYIFKYMCLCIAFQLLSIDDYNGHVLSREGHFIMTLPILQLLQSFFISSMIFLRPWSG